MTVVNLYTLTISVHVVTAILGLGQIVGTAVLASSTQPGAPVAPGALMALKRLGRGTTWALLLMLLSGMLLEYASGGSFHDTWWFRLSLLLLVSLGALQGASRRALRKLEPGSDSSRLLRRIVRIALAMCAIVALITTLMEVKPW
jgi:hypothetical protein